MPVMSRVLGAATVAYSAAIIARPALLAKPCGMARPDGGVDPRIRTLIGAIGARDTAIGAAMMVVPAGRALHVALAARVASDLADAVMFGLGLPDRGARAKVVGVAAGWAVLCAASALAP
ncbi:hypothetical protein ALI144C_05925 [Actinosynnema sp. ALI-1.44]|uniref:hypothetical protein n=1 Tax=Actinosynnema sp. ALI-1.44 TaxID=1933779 RepID=UPI00097C1EC0|nr:hypothetical protein [Actinosynnema sp. ALI-1.44]ONI89030.1 hypothetical protein ALI144C_05925 [Actinosynnema sp. ALI-1.44]